MQRPTCSGLRVRSPADAQVIFHAVSLNILPMVSRRLDTDERRAISSGCVFVWEERGPNAEATGLGIERWTDGIRWGPSRVRDEFLFYHEKDAAPTEDIASDSDSSQSHAGPSHSRGLLRDNLIKQTYSVFVDTPRGRRKWHLSKAFSSIRQLANMSLQGLIFALSSRLFHPRLHRLPPLHRRHSPTRQSPRSSRQLQKCSISQRSSPRAPASRPPTTTDLQSPCPPSSLLCLSIRKSPCLFRFQT
jgi:hypothetical protein